MRLSSVTGRLFRFVATASVSGLLLCALLFLGAYAYFAPQLPSIASLKDPKLTVPLKIYTADHQLIGEFGPNRRSPVKYKDFPPRLIHAFLAAEDANFFHHPGVSVKGLLRAAVNLALTGRKTQGGSTITMQVARNYFLSDRKTFTRKFREILLALRIDRRYSKQKILELYLNKIYFGEGAYGISAAAQTYYGENLDQLTLAQTAMLAGLPQAPSAANPLSDGQAATQRRNYVLGRMRDLGYLDRDTYRQAISEPLTAKLHREQIPVTAGYVADFAREHMLKKYGKKAYTSGYRVITTLDSSDQQDAVQALRADLLAYDRRHGYRGPEGRISLPPSGGPLPVHRIRQALNQHPGLGGLSTGVVVAVQDKSARVYTLDHGGVQVDWDGLGWARPYKGPNARGPAPKTASDVVSRGDIVRLARKSGSGGWMLAEIPKVQGALVALDPRTGATRALVGGFDFRQSKYDRALMAHRQPGSSFKPYIYSAALHSGMTQATVVNNAPVVVPGGFDATWRPQNYERTFSGPTPLRQGLFHSLNLVTIRVLQRIGLGNARKYVSRFGFPEKQLPDNLTLALGSAAVTPLQMARGYSVFANGGFLIKPHLIRKIIGPDGKTLYQAQPVSACPSGGTGDETEGCAPRVISAQNAYIMTEMMHGVIQHGTGRAARKLGRADLAGKTGTTNQQKDAWFDGFNRQLVAISWVGFDQPATLGHYETGARAALPMWMDFMGAALRGTPESPPLEPSGLVTARVDPATGKRVHRAASASVFETFRADNLPPFEDRNAYAGTSAGSPEPGGSASSSSSGNLERSLY
ncbi:MAG TPA: PBP1A family penicillin-binding protein [Gammaproteobacteria bacterium]|nr:PBP1A family penicillin-binding protein [Gammaproteobacteria bacterium]